MATGVFWAPSGESCQAGSGPQKGPGVQAMRWQRNVDAQRDHSGEKDRGRRKRPKWAEGLRALATTSSLVVFVKQEDCAADDKAKRFRAWKTEGRKNMRFIIHRLEMKFKLRGRMSRKPVKTCA